MKKSKKKVNSKLRKAPSSLEEALSGQGSTGNLQDIDIDLAPAKEAIGKGVSALGLFSKKLANKVFPTEESLLEDKERKIEALKKKIRLTKLEHEYNKELLALQKLEEETKNVE